MDLRGIKGFKEKKNFKRLQLAVLAFISEKQMKQLNHRFRGKNKATDILSFSSLEKGLGELALCPTVIKKNACMRSPREETAYMIVHGVLHLLGFDHEKSRLQARQMYRLQDQIFDQLRRKICL